VDERIGSRTSEEAPQSEDLFDDVLTALSTSEAWTAVPSSTNAGVLVAQSEPADDLVLMPDGWIRVSQKVVPLNVDIDKVGDAPSEPYRRFELEAADTTQDVGPVQDWFAPGYYFTLGAAEQLSAPSFELMDSGIEVGAGEPLAGKARTGTLAFEQVLRDPQLGEDRAKPTATPTAIAWSLSADDYLVPSSPLKLRDKSYAVTDPVTGEVVHRADSWSKARQSRVAGMVVPSWEALDSGHQAR
jgi:hypothetical protein